MSKKLTTCLIAIVLISACGMVLSQGGFPPPPSPGESSGPSSPSAPPPLPPPPPDSPEMLPPDTSSDPGSMSEQENLNGQIEENRSGDDKSVSKSSNDSDKPSGGRKNSSGSSNSTGTGSSAGISATKQGGRKDPADYSPSPKLTISSSVSTSIANWNMLGKNPDHDSYVTEKLSFPLKLNWKYITGLTADNPPSPVVSDGVMYFCAASRLYAMDAESGMLYWKYPSDQPAEANITLAPCVGDDLVYIGTGDGKLIAVKKKNGEQAWTFATKGAISSAPVLSSGVLFVGSTDRRLYTLDAVTGHPIWKGGFVTHDSIVGAPVVHGGLVYFISSDMTMYSAVVSTGQIKWWTRTGPTSKTSSPVFGDNLVFLASGGMIQAFQAQTGYQQWAITLPGDLTTTPIYANGTLYYACSDHKVYAVTRNKTMRWKAPYDLKANAYGTPVVVGNTLIVGGGKGNLVALDTETGKEKWTYTVPPSDLGYGKYEYVNMSAPLVVYKGSLYTFSDDGTLFSFRSDISDNTPPIVSLVAPRRDSVQPGLGTLTLGAIVSDEGSGVNWSTVSLSLDDSPVDFKTKPERGLIWFKRKATETGRLEALSDGRHTVKLTLADWAGNKTTTEWYFMVDNKITARPDETNTEAPGRPQSGNRSQRNPSGSRGTSSPFGRNPRSGPN